MQVSGACQIEASREAVWLALQDAEALARDLAACEGWTRLGEGAWRVGVAAGSSMVDVDVELMASHAPESCRLRAAVDGGQAELGVLLEASGAGTLLQYEFSGSLPGLDEAAVRSLLETGCEQLRRRTGADGAASEPRYQPSGQGRIWLVVFALLALAALLALFSS